MAELAQRVVVLSGGRVTDRFGVEEMTSARLGAVMAGLAWDPASEAGHSQTDSGVPE